MGISIFFEINEIPIFDLKVGYKFIVGKSDYKQYENISEKLGFKKDDKLLIIHADDLGLSRSVNKASFDALKKGHVNSASIMMTCKHINEVGKFAIENPEIDLGLHLTVTSEWRDYKWDGVLDSSKIPSMIDNKGHLFNNKKKFVLYANPYDLKNELQAQIDLAKSIGIRPSHIDSHEGALFFKQDLFKVYLEIGEENKLPVFVPKLVATHFDKDFPKPKNVVIVENFFMASPKIEFSDWENYYITILNNLKPGLSEIIVHLGIDDNEMQNITIEHPNFGSEWRNLDYDVVSSEKFQDAIETNNVKLVTWRQIQNVIY
ncbi:MAG: polysaccharide deacetylase family protein [Flavobacteriaceae bacterium]|nr:polysaccharide deacetylase family protein [Flavobacteriaceae bacterium]